MALPQGINWNTWTLGQFLQSASGMTVEELRAAIRDLQSALQTQVPILAAIEAPYVSGPDAAGAAVTGNPVVIGGRDLGGLVRVIQPDTSGRVFVRNQVVDDANTAHDQLSDRTGILAVAPPVSKLFSQGGGQGVGLALSLTQAAPGVGLRNILLGLSITITTAATAQPALTFTFGTSPAGSGNVVLACPANDTRTWTFPAPILCAANTAAILSSSAAPAAGAYLTGVLTGYVASFP